MSKNRLLSGAVVVAVLAASAAMLAVDREREAGKQQQETGQARVHHQVPGRLLLHARQRREEVGQGDTRAPG